MNDPTNIQIISQDGRPAFVVIPYDECVRTFRKMPRIPESGNIPNVLFSMDGFALLGFRCRCRHRRGWFGVGAAFPSWSLTPNIMINVAAL